MTVPISSRAFALMFAFGAIVLTLLDSIHVHAHTLAYEHPVAFGSAWWVPLLMGGSASIGAVLYVWGWSRWGSPKLPTRSAVARAVLAFAVMYAASGLLPASHVTKLIVIAIAAVVIFREVDGTRIGALFIVIGSIAGSFAEAINHGFFYLDPDFCRIPMWLPALYACATPALGQLARLVAARFPVLRSGA
jgi:hypothetical protein